ncbi:hypothetical protein CYY_008475 [Polysphondylium violaceum]|uniref:LysM domain-containing protein n=1 Tax=Polysphondylium violaceum TaxID=133409 RepID=A0A8J4UWX3_9MYCE|nr:hypothetical protein CYY_008475 [Polysphondylium violaceum]
MNKILALLVIVFAVLGFAAAESLYDRVPAGCKSWHQVASGYTCDSMARGCGISLSAFQALNNYPPCGNLEIGQYYCCQY